MTARLALKLVKKRKKELISLMRKKSKPRHHRDYTSYAPFSLAGSLAPSLAAAPPSLVFSFSDEDDDALPAPPALPLLAASCHAGMAGLPPLALPPKDGTGGGEPLPVRMGDE